MDREKSAEAMWKHFSDSKIWPGKFKVEMKY